MPPSEVLATVSLKYSGGAPADSRMVSISFSLISMNSYAVPADSDWSQWAPIVVLSGTATGKIRLRTLRHLPRKTVTLQRTRQAGCLFAAFFQPGPTCGTILWRMHVHKKNFCADCLFGGLWSGADFRLLMLCKQELAASRRYRGYYHLYSSKVKMSIGKHSYF